MKTISDLNNLIPQLIDHVLDKPEIGGCYYGQCEDDYDETWADNYVCYDEDGWCIEIYFKCCGEWDNDPGDYWAPPRSELLRAWGEVTEITAYHYDEKTDEETGFCNDDLKELWSALDKALEKI